MSLSLEFAMGHVLLDPPSRTGKWKQIIAFMEAGAGVPQIANATVDAAQATLQRAADDRGVIETVWLLMRAPLAARSDNFADGLRDCGLVVSDRPSLIEIVGAFGIAIDAKMPNCRGRTDLAEMAQMAASEALTQCIGRELPKLFGCSPEEVQQAFARTATPKRFGILARDFFSRFIYKQLDFHLSKIVPEHTGHNKRFRTLAAQASFTEALETHCREAAKVVEEYSAGWFSKHNWLTAGDITRDDVARFTGYGMQKLIKALQQRGCANAQ